MKTISRAHRASGISTYTCPFLRFITETENVFTLYIRIGRVVVVGVVAFVFYNSSTLLRSLRAWSFILSTLSWAGFQSGSPVQSAHIVASN